MGNRGINFNGYSIRDDVVPALEQILKLYNDVQWSSYTDHPETLHNAILHSLKVWTVWDDGQLIGLARVVGDGYSIIYVQDLLVLEQYQRQGIGRKLLELILHEYESVRQIVLMTDNTEKTIQFYKQNGFAEVSQIGIAGFMRINKTDEEVYVEKIGISRTF